MDTVTTSTIETERTRFIPLLLSNPNYFGNLEHSPFKAVKKIVSNTTYEELKCIGFNPQLSRLEGVVWVKQASGYDGGICTDGSLEYVSFYLSYDGGASWLLQGTTSFKVFDVPGQHPLEYGVSLVIQPPKKLCSVNNLPVVRAVLSWNVPPSGPSIPPVWGNVLDARIQLPGFLYRIPVREFLEQSDAKLSKAALETLPENATLPLEAPKPLGLVELKQMYSKTDVPAHRYLHGAIQKAISNPAKLAVSEKFLSKLDVDLSAVLASLENANGSTKYEQLGCIGLEEGFGLVDALVGTLVVKLPAGYLGNPCTAGSREYVAFWMDWGGGWEWVGTTSVSVHDIEAIPKEGLNYAVYLPVNLNSHRKQCQEGIVTARVRAILSWNTPPPPFNPDFVPVWGNRLETRILVNPGAVGKAGDFTPYLTSICDVPVCDIDQGSGWAFPGTGDHPFGGLISIYGSIPGAPLFTWPLSPMPKYQVTVQQIDTTTNALLGSPQILTDPFELMVTQEIGGTVPTSFPVNQNAPAGYFNYEETNAGPGGWRIVSPQGLLAQWYSGTNTGTWLVSVTAWDAGLTTKYPAGSAICTLDGTTRKGVVIDLDQAQPIASLAISGYKPAGVGPCQPAQNCQTFTVGDVICGTYSVYDEHQGSLSLQAEPTPLPGSGFTIDGNNTSSLSYPIDLPSAGVKSGEWTYNTAGLPPCGYTIRLQCSDRTIVNCTGVWSDDTFVGCCLVAPGVKQG
jgi:hypothetical protein